MNYDGDYFKLESFLSKKQRATRDRVREYMEEVVRPNIDTYWNEEDFPMDLALGLKDLNIAGGILNKWGAAGLDPLEVGLISYEMARVDGSIGTFFGVHSGLAMMSIGLLGSDEQRERWIPDMVEMKKIGAFGLTEPERGSAAVDLQTTARCVDGDWVLNGAKRWIGNAEIADVLIIWARDENGDFGGFVVENPQEAEGLSMERITGKIGKRAVWNAHITLEDVRVPAENRLPKVKTFKDIGKVLVMGRYGVAWEAAGVAAGAFEAALKYAMQREQFGRPIAGFQLIQQKLVEMLSEVTQMQLMSYQMASLIAQDALTPGIASLAKYNNARKARYVTQLARETLGGNGILIENEVARLMMDAEVIYTYEGTNEINMLIAGRELTGLSAFT